MKKKSGSHSGTTCCAEILADPFPGKAKPPAQQRKQLAAPTVAIAVCFPPPATEIMSGRKKQTSPSHAKECLQSQEGNKRKKRSKDNHTSVFHAVTSPMAMTAAGHSLAHFPQPMHFSASTAANMPPTTAMAFLGQTLRQHPQATHSACSTNATLFRFPVSRTKSTSSFNNISIQGGRIPIRDKLTVGHHSFRANPPPRPHFF